MSRASVLILVGALVILAPFSGLPVAIRTLVAIGLGAVVVGIGVALRSAEQHRLVAAQSVALPPEAVPLEPPHAVEASEPSPAPAEAEAPRSRRSSRRVISSF